jgi:hypothetical protein
LVFGLRAVSPCIDIEVLGLHKGNVFKGFLFQSKSDWCKIYGSKGPDHWDFGIFYNEGVRISNNATQDFSLGFLH